jgi:multiple antibiotic resistance protein
MGSAASDFLLAFPAIFSIVNPLAGAFIFNEVAGELSREERSWLARRVALYSLLVMLATLWGGAYVLNFFGISIAALRLGGGSVVILRAWDLLAAPERQEARKQAQAGMGAGAVPGVKPDEVAFFPLTIPFTTGPGTMSVTITLGAGHPAGTSELPGFFLGMSGAAVAVALCIWAFYHFAARVAAMLSTTTRRVITRLTAFLLLCIGVQIAIAGVLEVVALAVSGARG